MPYHLGNECRINGTGSTDPVGYPSDRLTHRPDITIYPDQTHGDRGGYHHDTLVVAEDLRQAGLEVRPRHAPSHCDLIGERGQVVNAALGLVLGVASSAGWDAIKALLRRRATNDPVKLTVGWRTAEGEQWVQIEGQADAVVDVLNDIHP